MPEEEDFPLCPGPVIIDRSSGAGVPFPADRSHRVRAVSSEPTTQRGLEPRPRWPWSPCLPALLLIWPRVRRPPASALAAPLEDGVRDVAEQGCRNAVSKPEQHCQYVGQERREGPDNSFSAEKLPEALELCVRAIPQLVG